MTQKLLLPLVICIIAMIFLFSFSTAQADSATPSATIKVDHIAGILEKIGEKISMFFKFNKEDKVAYYQELLNKRLAEVNFVMETEQGDMIEETTTRYNAYLGNLSDYLIKNKVISKKESTLAIFEKDTKVFEKLHMQVPVDSGFWILIQHNINSIKIFKEKISQI